MLGVHSATYGTVHLIIKTIRMTSFNKSPDLPQAIYTDTELNFPSHVVTVVVHSSCLPIGYDIIEPFRGYHDTLFSGIVMASVWLHPPPTHADWATHLLLPISSLKSIKWSSTRVSDDFELKTLFVNLVYIKTHFSVTRVDMILHLLYINYLHIDL